MKLFHLGFDTEDISAKYAILPGDPGRVKDIAAHFDGGAFFCQNREYMSYTGDILGKQVIACSTGIGGPSAAIAVEELYMCGVRTFIRVGTAGGIALNVSGGDVVIASAATRNEGTTFQYAPSAFPAAADFDVTAALRDSAEALGYKYHVGTVHCKDSFYGQHQPGRMPVAESLIAEWSAYNKLGVLASEMESSTIYIVAASLGARAGSVLNIVWNQEKEAALGSKDEEEIDNSKSIKVAVMAVTELIKKDF